MFNLSYRWFSWCPDGVSIWRQGGVSLNEIFSGKGAHLRIEMSVFQASRFAKLLKESSITLYELQIPQPVRKIETVKQIVMQTIFFITFRVNGKEKIMIRFTYRDDIYLSNWFDSLPHAEVNTDPSYKKANGQLPTDFSWLINSIRHLEHTMAKINKRKKTQSGIQDKTIKIDWLIGFLWVDLR